jgi:hypothetical protein
METNTRGRHTGKQTYSTVHTVHTDIETLKYTETQKDINQAYTQTHQYTDRQTNKQTDTQTVSDTQRDIQTLTDTCLRQTHIHVQYNTCKYDVLIHKTS